MMTYIGRWLRVAGIAGCMAAAACPVTAAAGGQDWKSNAIADSPVEDAAIQGESILMARYPGLAKREGRTLIISYAGKVVATLVPGKADDIHGRSGLVCDRYILGKVLMLYDPATQTRQPMAEVACYAGEFDSAIDVLPDGQLWSTSGLSASPDGKMIAINAYDPWHDDPDQGFTLQTWPEQKVVARFEPDCRVLSWQDNTHLSARCAYDPNPRSADAPFCFEARVWIEPAGDWLMQSADDLPEDAAELDTAMVPGPPHIANARQPGSVMSFSGELRPR